MIRYYSGLAPSLMSGVSYLISDYLGIDPGLNGGFVVVSGDKIKYKMVMPTLSFTTKAGKTKTELDRQAILSFLAMQPKHTHVAIEKQEAFRSQNITATCTTCKNYGSLLMGLSFAHLYITEVHPDTWHSHFGIVSANRADGKSTKEQAFDIAQTLYSGEDFRKSYRSHKFHDGLIDGVLLATYCQFLFEGENNDSHQMMRNKI